MRIYSPRNYFDLVYEVTMGKKVPSERGNTYEIQDMLMVIENPRDRIVTDRWRRMNIGFAITDALSHIVGDDALEPLLLFAPSFSKFSTDGHTIDGAYGARIHSSEQLRIIIDMLKENPQTRRAVLSIYMGPQDLCGGGGTNTPCTLNFHFLVRDGRLNMKVMMRSNDVILGLTNDIFTFTFLHEYVSIVTGIPLGTYSHYASSFHVYESDLYKYRNMKPEVPWTSIMDPMPTSFNPERVYGSICSLKGTTPFDCHSICSENTYERNLFLSAAAVYHRKHKSAYLLAERITDATLKRMVEMFVLSDEMKERT